MSFTDKLFATVKSTDNSLYAITVIENGESRTLRLSPANMTNNCYSVAKVFTLTALGMLCDAGLLSLDEHIVDIFADDMLDTADSKWERVTVEHAITHRIGFEHGFLDIDAEDPASFGSDDYLGIVLSRPLKYVPGEKEVYSDAAYYLLSRVVTKKTGENLDDFLRLRLYRPLGFAEVAWSRCPHGYAMGATGLYMRTPDIAKLGGVYAGMYGGRQIVSREWCDLVQAREYGFWRLGSGYAKGGMFGQLLWYDPERNLALAWQGYDETGKNGLLQNLLSSLK